MNTRHVIMIVGLLSLWSTALSQQHGPPKQDVVSVVYEFTLSTDGKPRDIKVSQAFWQKDHRDAMGVLTDADKTRGAGLIASHAYHPRPDQIGKKRYDFVLFDTKSKQFGRGTRPH